MLFFFEEINFAMLKNSQKNITFY